MIYDLRFKSGAICAAFAFALWLAFLVKSSVHSPISKEHPQAARQIKCPRAVSAEKLYDLTDPPDRSPVLALREVAVLRAGSATSTNHSNGNGNRG